MDDIEFMNEALNLARAAYSLHEVPVGAVVVKDGLIVGRAHNRRESDHSALAHAEVLAIQEASLTLQAWRLIGCTLYVTLEPCLMCAGAIIQSRIERVVYGASDPKGGALGSLYSIHEDQRLNHRVAVTTGVCGHEAGQLLSDFFKARRRQSGN